jgi:hypothetical protein
MAPVCDDLNRVFVKIKTCLHSTRNAEGIFACHTLHTGVEMRDARVTVGKCLLHHGEIRIGMRRRNRYPKRGRRFAKL